MWFGTRGWATLGLGAQCGPFDTTVGTPRARAKDHNALAQRAETVLGWGNLSELLPQSEIRFALEREPQRGNKRNGEPNPHHPRVCTRVLLADTRHPCRSREDCQNDDTSPLETPPGVRMGMGIARAHRAPPMAPKAERQHKDKKEVHYVEASDPVRASWRLARKAEIVSVGDDLALDRVYAVHNQQ